MKIEHHAITSLAADDGRNDDKLVLGDEIADASLLAGRFVAWVGLNIELERGDEGQACQQKQAGEKSVQWLHGCVYELKSRGIASWHEIPEQEQRCKLHAPLGLAHHSRADSGRRPSRASRLGFPPERQQTLFLPPCSVADWLARRSHRGGLSKEDG